MDTAVFTQLGSSGVSLLGEVATKVVAWSGAAQLIG